MNKQHAPTAHVLERKDLLALRERWSDTVRYDELPSWLDWDDYVAMQSELEEEEEDGDNEEEDGAL